MTAIRDGVLAFVEALRLAPGRYRMGEGLGSTLFTDCFAFFTRWLLADDYAPDERAALEASLLEGQDPQSGLWRAPRRREGLHELHSAEHLDRQLTGFALAALAALGRRPRHALSFLEAWSSERAVHAYLDGLPWRQNPWNSGNRAMFVGGFLAYDAWVLRGQSGPPSPAWEAWFAWHERAARPGSGFWGEGHWADWYIGMGGAAHQYVLYQFSRRKPPHLARAVERTLRLQYPDGRFWPVAGGGSCYELDAMQILSLGHDSLPEQRPEIRRAAGRAIDVVLASRNRDGGFCWAARRWFDPRDVLSGLRVTRDFKATWWSLKAQASAHVLRARERRATGWNEETNPVGQSTLFDTWFRALTLAQVARIADDPRLAGLRFRSLPAPNWGCLEPWAAA